jgi:regulatory protein
MIGEEGTILISWAYRYLSYRSRTEKEMREYLLKKAHTYGFSSELVDEVITLLKEEQYLDDRAFIAEFVRARSSSKPKGVFVLRQELLHKGISQILLDEYFESHILPELDLAQKALQKIWYRLKSLEPLLRRKRAGDFLRRRGFTYDAIQETIEELEGREYN